MRQRILGVAGAEPRVVVDAEEVAAGAALRVLEPDVTRDSYLVPWARVLHINYLRLCGLEVGRSLFDHSRRHYPLSYPFLFYSWRSYSATPDVRAEGRPRMVRARLQIVHDDLHPPSFLNYASGRTFTLLNMTTCACKDSDAPAPALGDA